MKTMAALTIRTTRTSSTYATMKQKTHAEITTTADITTTTITEVRAAAHEMPIPTTAAETLNSADIMKTCTHQATTEEDTMITIVTHSATPATAPTRPTDTTKAMTTTEATAWAHTCMDTYRMTTDEMAFGCFTPCKHDNSYA